MRENKTDPERETEDKVGQSVSRQHLSPRFRRFLESGVPLPFWNVLLYVNEVKMGFCHLQTQNPDQHHELKKILPQQTWR